MNPEKGEVWRDKLNRMHVSIEEVARDNSGKKFVKYHSFNRLQINSYLEYFLDGFEAVSWAKGIKLGLNFDRLVAIEEMVRKVKAL